MRILWLRPNKPANISVGRHRIAEGLRNRGHKVDMWNTKPADFYRITGESTDVMIGTTRLGAFVSTFGKVINRTPLVVDHIDPIRQLRRSHGRVVTRTVGSIEAVSFAVADAVMVVYDEEVDRVSRWADAVTETTLGVDYDLFANPSDRVLRVADRTLFKSIPEDAQTLIYVGGLEPDYKLPVVADAVDSLDDWHFVVLGDGSQQEWLESVSKTRGDVHYFGTVPYEEVAGYMALSDVGISLLDDRNTLKVLEYGASGLPVVHAEGDTESKFSDGVVFCSPTPDEVAAAVRTASSLDAHEMARIAEAHDWSTVTSTYEDVLQGVVTEYE